jgi:hypothetical protein
LCKFTRKISNVENLHDLNVFFYTSSKKSTFKAGNKAQIHTIFFNRECGLKIWMNLFFVLFLESPDKRKLESSYQKKKNIYILAWATTLIGSITKQIKLKNYSTFVENLHSVAILILLKNIYIFHAFCCTITSWIFFRHFEFFLYFNF